MPKALTTPLKNASNDAKSSPTSGRSGGSREPTAYRKFCMENRERIKAEFPDLKGKDLTAKLADSWWESEENPRRGNRPVKKVKTVKDKKSKGDEDKDKSKGSKGNEKSEGSEDKENKVKGVKKTKKASSD